MALATRQISQSDLLPSSPTYTKFDKKPAARSDGGDASEDDRVVNQNMAEEMYQKYDFIDPYDPRWDGSPYEAKPTDKPYFVEYANQLKTTEGADLKRSKILNANCHIISSALYFLTLQCSDGLFYEAKIDMRFRDEGCALVMFRPAKKDKNTNDEGGAEPEVL
ncbi:hypothetical protein LWI28_018604 [Acer negundo]|uniref:Cystatin domain-containing protein n=1 Tax=Acer negundo TaxID=4023 RepID=A0AAD5J700_ACENE|nr:hypothetical protein LWI28_018604 [Acer negundo]